MKSLVELQVQDALAADALAGDPVLGGAPDAHLFDLAERQRQRRGERRVGDERQDELRLERRAGVAVGGRLPARCTRVVRRPRRHALR